MAPRTIVVGAGILGIAVAERLAASGDRVTLVDRAAPGGGTSRTSFGWLNANGKVPRSYHDLNVAGVAAYRRLVGDPDVAAWLHLEGRLQWAESPADIDSLEREALAMRAWDYPVEAITADAARRLEPDLRIGPGAEVRFWPSEGFVVPDLLLAWLLRRAGSRGVEVIRDARVTGFHVRGGAVAGVRLDGGNSLEGERVVVCVGRWSEALLAEVGVRVPMQPVTAGSAALGLLGYTGRAAARLRRTISNPGLNVRPDGDVGRFVLQGIGLDGLADPDVPPDPAGVIAMELLTRAQASLAGFDEARLDELRVGYRAVPADRLTVAGWAPGVDGLYVVATHSGFTLALHLGELIAAEIGEGVSERSLADFRPTRFKDPVDLVETAGRPIH
ncbi:MAG: FAD-binding oxidoreductase [Chloroflexota bacterium]